MPDVPPSKPVDVDGVRTVLTGTALWAVALVVMVVLRDDLAASGNEWWLWTCVAGTGLGLLGYAYTRRRRDAIARVRAFQQTQEPTA